MKILLIGCTGFIGRELVPSLIDSGHELTVVSRNKIENIYKKLKTKNFSFIQMDPSNSKAWDNEKIIESLRSVDGIINLAGEPIAEKKWTNSQCQRIKDSRLITTSCLITKLGQLKQKPRFLINASAIGYYGNSETKEFNENSRPGNDFLSSLCKNWEEISSQKPRSTRLITLRIGIVLAKDGGALGKMLPIFQAGLGGPIGSGKQWMSWIDRTDLCNIINQAVKNTSWKGVINCVSPKPVKMEEFSKTLAESIGRPNCIRVPKLILQLTLGEGASVILEGQNVQPESLKRFRFKFKYPDLKQSLDISINS